MGQNIGKETEHLEICAHFFGARRFARPDRFQLKLRMTLLHLLHTAVDDASWRREIKGKADIFKLKCSVY